MWLRVCLLCWMSVAKTRVLLPNCGRAAKGCILGIQRFAGLYLLEPAVVVFGRQNLAFGAVYLCLFCGGEGHIVASVQHSNLHHFLILV